MDLRLPPKFGFNWGDGQAVAFYPAVAAAFTDRFVDEHAHRGGRELAALAQPALLGGAPLVVDERGDAGDLAQEDLDLVESAPGPDLDAARPLGVPPVLVGLAGHHDDPLHPLPLHRTPPVVHGAAASRYLPP